MFSRIVSDYWLPRDAAADGGYTVVVDDSLPANRSLMILEPVGGGGVLTLTPAHAAGLEVTGGSTVGGPELRSALEVAKVKLNGADHLFYLPADQHALVRAEAVPEGT